MSWMMNQSTSLSIASANTQASGSYDTKDLFHGFIVAHRLGQHQTVTLVADTIKIAKEKVTDGLILHSDQGHQYTSHRYFVLTNQDDITPSMSRR